MPAKRKDNTINYNEIEGWENFTRSEKCKYYVRAQKLRDPDIYKKKRRDYYINNIEKIKELNRLYNNELNEEISKRRKENYNPIKKSEYYFKNKDNKNKYSREYAFKNRNLLRIKSREYIKNRLKIDILFRIDRYIRTSICNSFQYIKSRKNTKTSDILGITTSEFKLYLESKFEPWMNWENKGLYNGEFNYGWDIDHIVPISSCKTIDDVIKLNHYTNLQPLCSHINRDLKRNHVNFKYHDK